MGAPRVIIEILKGYRIPFIRRPPLSKLSVGVGKTFAPSPSSLMTSQIQQLLEIGVLSENKFTTGYLSPIFLRAKPDGSHRLIVNLKSLNNFVYTQKFRLISFNKISQIIENGDFLIKIDISNAYYHIPMRMSHERFLSICYRNKIYNIKCLPFGLSSAPSIFAKFSNWITKLLREKGIKVIVYLDDFLLMHQDANVLSEQANWVLNFLTELGWHINADKTDLTPKRRIEYLGLIWDTQYNIKMLPATKVNDVTKNVKDLLHKNEWSWFEAKRLLGKLVFASNAIPLGLLHCRLLQISSRQLPESRKFAALPLPEQVATELQWWRENLSQSSAIQIAAPSAFLTTDASDEGWGAILNGKKLSGIWEAHQRSWHSNQKELWTLLEVLKLEFMTLKGKTILFQSDNRTAVYYIRKQGGTKSLHLLETASLILKFSQNHNITIVPKYLPGKYNGLTDRLSRQKIQQEWHLSSHIQKIIFRRMGVPEIDLFASNRSAVVKRYVSENAKDTNSEYTDAFSRFWNYKLAWVFPPPALIPRILQHLNGSKGIYLLVSPNWNKAFWKPEVKRRAIAPPFRIKNLKAHLTDLNTNLPPREIANLCLQVWKIRAGRLK